MDESYSDSDYVKENYQNNCLWTFIFNVKNLLVFKIDRIPLDSNGGKSIPPHTPLPLLKLFPDFSIRGKLKNISKIFKSMLAFSP